MLIKCPECELQASDKANTCPHCGYPLKGTVTKNEKRKSNKRKRLPNGFGQITKLRNRNLRNPYRAMVTVGKDENGRPICKLIEPVAYFPTYNDAYAALVEYNRNPYDLDSMITMNELYKRWTNDYFEKINVSSTRAIKASWDYCSDLYNMKVVDVRARHIKGCIDNGYRTVKGEKRTASASFKNRIKSTISSMLDYAVEYDIIDRNYARSFDLGLENAKDVKNDRKSHMAYSIDEMTAIWNNKDIPYADILLIQCYSGWRPQELCKLKLEDVNIIDWTFKGGMKTDSGKNRVVPIHSRIKDLVKTRYDEAAQLGSEYLLNAIDNGYRPLTYAKYRAKFLNIVNELGLDSRHRCHDGRVQFVTMAKKYSVDEYAIKYIVGHAINDLTEKVYTKRDIDWLREEIEKIK